MSPDEQIEQLKKKIHDLEWTITDMNEKWHTDRAELLKLKANAAYWLGPEKAQLLDGEHA